MCLSKVNVCVLVLAGIVGLALLPERAAAQYRCAVAIELKGQPVLAGEIRDTERPATDELWQLLKTLSFAATAKGKDLPDPQKTERTALKGDVRVKINGAGEVRVTELRLVRNPFNDAAWIIAPEDVARILKMRQRKTRGSAPK